MKYDDTETIGRIEVAGGWVYSDWDCNYIFVSYDGTVITKECY